MKLFISQPMRDRSTEDIVAERKALTQFSRNKLCDHELTVIDSLFDHNTAQPPLHYLGEAIKLMADADAVVFAKGWHGYNGCVIEHECAVRYGKIIIYA